MLNQIFPSQMTKGYYHTQESVREYIELAKDVSGKALIGIFKEYLAEGSRLLELGSGPGTDWNILSKHFAVTGSDLSLEFLKHLKQSYPEGDFMELDAVSILTDRKFDGIYSNKVLHHLTTTDLKTSIQRQYELLYPGGVVCHSFWKGEGSENFKGMYVNYHTSEELQDFFSPLYEVKLMNYYAEFEADDSILLIAVKK